MKTKTLDDLYQYCERIVPDRRNNLNSLYLAPYRTAYELYSTDGYRLHYLTGLPIGTSGYIRDVGDPEPFLFRQVLGQSKVSEAQVVSAFGLNRDAYKSLDQLIAATAAHGSRMVDLTFYATGLQIAYQPADRDYYPAATLRATWTASLGVYYPGEANVTGRARVAGQHLIDALVALVPKTRVTFSLCGDNDRLLVRFPIHGEFGATSEPIYANALIGCNLDL